MARRLGPAIPFYGVSVAEPPKGLSAAELIATVADRFLPDLHAVFPHGPYHLGGHSLGGIVALEVARRLIAAGETVALLALLDVRGPNYPRRRPTVEWLAAHAANLRGRPALEALSFLGNKLRSKLRPQNHIHINSESTRDSLTYPYREYIHDLRPYPGRITLLRATSQPDDTPRFVYDDPTNGWGAVAEGGVETIPVPGNHWSIIEPPNLAKLADALRSCLSDPCNFIQRSLSRSPDASCSTNLEK